MHSLISLMDNFLIGITREIYSRKPDDGLKKSGIFQAKYFFKDIAILSFG